MPLQPDSSTFSSSSPSSLSSSSSNNSNNGNNNSNNSVSDQFTAIIRSQRDRLRDKVEELEIAKANLKNELELAWRETEQMKQENLSLFDELRMLRNQAREAGVTIGWHGGLQGGVRRGVASGTNNNNTSAGMLAGANGLNQTQFDDEGKPILSDSIHESDNLTIVQSIDSMLSLNVPSASVVGGSTSGSSLAHPVLNHSVIQKYSKLSADKNDPFNELKRLQLQSESTSSSGASGSGGAAVSASVPLSDRFLLWFTKQVITKKWTRKFFAFYILLLHLIVLVTIYNHTIGNHAHEHAHE
jgi:hypothetical protein